MGLPHPRQWCLVLLACSARTAALPALPLPLDPPLIQISQAEGLGSNQVRRVLQDARGNLWIATQQGLDSYQPPAFTAHFDASNTVLLPDARLTAMVQDARGRLWFGTYGGLVRYADNAFTSFTKASNGLADNRLICALTDLQGRLWLGTWKGLVRYEGQDFKSLTSAAGLPAAPISALLMDRSGCLWIGCARGGLWRSEGRDLERFDQVQGPAGLQVHTLCEDRRGRLWIGSVGNGLLRCDGQARSMAPAGLGAAAVFCLYEDREGRLWAGTGDGLYWLSEETWQAVPLGSEGAPRVAVLGEDREQRLWIGTEDRGLWCRQGGSCSRVEELAGRSIHAILQDRKQQLWATTDQGLYGLQEGSWKRISIPPALFAAELGGLLEDDRGNLWVSSQERGLLRFDGRRFAHFSPTHHLPRAEICALAQTPDSTLWLGTTAGLVAYDGEQFLTYGPEAGLPHAAVYALAATSGGDLWLGTGAGLARWQEGHLVTVVPAADLPGPVVRALAVGQAGELWIGTSGGLVHLQGDQRQTFTMADGLPDDHIRSLALDSRHRLWIATGAGLSLFDQRHFRTFTAADGLTSELLFTLCVDREDGVWAGSLSGGAVRYDGQRFYHLTTQEGLPSNTVRHIYQDAEGHLWLATDKGLVRCHRDAVSALGGPANWGWGLALLGGLALAAFACLLGLRRSLFRPGRSAGATNIFMLLPLGAALCCPSPSRGTPSPSFSITQVQSHRRPGALWLDVAYQLQGPQGQQAVVTMEASADGGRTYEVPVLSLAGDIGPVEPGPSKAILWDAGADCPGFFATPWQVRLAVSLTPLLPPGEDMVRIPEGPFTMGSTQGDLHERPPHQVHLPAFWIDRFETTNRAFMGFVQATGHQTAAEREGYSVIYVDGGYQTIADASWRAPAGPGSDLAGRLNHPVVQMTWEDARAYCQWAGKRLPTEAEWEKAARGHDRRTYPWGEDPPGAGGRYRANYGTDACCHESAQDGFLNTAPVGSFPLGVSPYGVYDLAGNVWEWTGDWYGETYYASSPARAPTGPTDGDERVLRGGSWISYLFMLRTTYRGRHTPDTRHNYSGFRCARDD